MRRRPKRKHKVISEFERNLFKAYLVLNDEFIKAQETAFSSTKGLDIDLKIPMIIFCMHYPISDKINYDIKEVWVTQMIKAVYLFQYLEENKNTQPLLAAFLKYYNRKNWVEYLKDLIPLTLPAIQNEKEAHIDFTVTQGDQFKDGCSFLEKLIVQDNDELDEDDFLSIRAKPFYKIQDGVYRIIFNLFVVEKIFKGVYFLLRDVNKSLAKEDKMPDLKGVYCYEFSEKILVYKTLNIIYSEKCIKFSGSQLKFDGAPDFYIRKGRNILLFESKDFLIRADKKASFDYKIYDEEFAKTLYYQELENGKEKAGAVMQLIGNIKRILRKEFVYDTDYFYKEVFIYPIVITHDIQYDVPGFNYLINDWFQEELSALKDEKLFIRHVKPLTVINIDSLIYNQNTLNEKIRLHEVLNQYEEQTKIDSRLNFKSTEERKNYIFSKLIPFSIFIDKYLYKNDLWKAPSILDLIAPAIFPDEYQKVKNG